MATYVYETIPQKPGSRPRRFEVAQSMKDAALTHDPETGEPVRRVISGGLGFYGAATGYAASGPECCAARPETGGHCCGPNCGCA